MNRRIDDRAAGCARALRIVAGWLGWPHSLGGSDRFTKFLEPVFASEARVLQVEGRTSQLVPERKKNTIPGRSGC